MCPVDLVVSMPALLEKVGGSGPSVLLTILYIYLMGEGCILVCEGL